MKPNTDRNDRLRLIFSNSPLPLSLAIRAATWSEWSHVGIIIDDNRVVDATYTHHGVKVRTIDSFIKSSHEWTIVEVDVGDAAAIIRAALTQVDRPYDVTGLFGILFRNYRWNEDDSWFCSELVAYAMWKGGTPIVGPSYNWRVTPQKVWKHPHRVIMSGYGGAGFLH